MLVLNQVQLLASRMDWKVFPVKDSKVPYIEKWPELATNDKTQLMLWDANFNEESTGMLWGLATGKRSKIVVLDIDKARAEIDLIAKYGPMPETVTAKTGRGGKHIYFNYPEAGKIATGQNVLFDGLDIRGEGGQVVIPPSRKRNGQVYTWEHSPDDYPLADLPDQLLEDLLLVVTDWVPLDQPWLERQNDHIYHWASMLYGQQNAEDVHARLLQKWQDGEIPDLDESDKWTEAKIRVAVDSGIKKAREYRTSKVIVDRAGQPLEYFTDLGLSDRDCVLRLVNKYAPDLRHATGLGFMVWDGKRWKRDKNLVMVTNMIGHLHPMLLQEAGAEGQGGTRQKKILRFRDLLGSRGRIDAVITLLSRHPEIQADPEDFDGFRGDYKLVFNNGVLDLRTKELTDHRKEDFLTVLIPVEWMPGGTCPTFEQTINWALGADAELIRDLQVELGSALSGADLDRLTILWGAEGDNGKSSILEAIADAIGSDYCQSISTEALMEKSNPNFKWSALASMRAARFVTASESSEDDKLALAIAKQLTGGDRISCKHMRGDHFSYRPRFRLILRTNILPKVDGIEQTIWKRLSPIPFDNQIPKDALKPRPEVDALFREERLGIIRWLVEGAYRSHQSGALRLDRYESKKIADLHKTWRQTSSPVWAFITDHCETGSQKLKVARSILNRAIKKYIKEHDLRKLSAQKIRADLTTILGDEFSCSRATDGFYYYYGVELIDKEINNGEVSATIINKHY